jgi:hypothetical protein
MENCEDEVKKLRLDTLDQVCAIDYCASTLVLVQTSLALIGTHRRPHRPKRGLQK